MEITFEIKNLKKFEDALGSINIRNILQETINNSTERLMATTKEYIIGGHNYSKAPYQTGHMYATIDKTILVGEGKVFPTVDYAYYVHEGRGTSVKYGRRPFLDDALKDTQKFVVDELKRLTDDALQKVAIKSK